jgi:ferredoxin
MRVLVDLNRCESYGQCVFAAPTVFRFHDEETLEYDYGPDDASLGQVRRAAAWCPVQAISIGAWREPPSRAGAAGAATGADRATGSRS